MTVLTPEDRYLAGRFMYLCGVYYAPPRVEAAQVAQSDLVGRSWSTGRDMTREERRLFDHYQSIIDADAVRWLEALRGPSDSPQEQQNDY